ncbi:lipopolysaccharide biosynthesis protein [Azovibrio restrictus]|uniref:lipopolysaccharide biosynthesis protein n=1 Tax=Azovibrio restrictus TaxID=146938 RepID=UPI0026ECC090|nr:oligosaccharide flippase family protein [Azovibrio restrictus]MDD3481483.1 oligosaccharide flippase family protein [Azovibrio restrictus]
MLKWHNLVSYRPGRLGRNTILGSTGLGFRAIVQAAYLLIVSRWLGAEGYGLFAGSVALVTLATPLANWGSALLLTEYVARDRSRSRGMWATALVQTGVVGGILAIGVLAISALLLREQLALGPLLLLAASELLLLPISHAASSQCSALEHGGAAALSVGLIPLGRTSAMLGVVACNLAATPELASVAHFSGTVLGLAAAVMLVTRVDGPPAWDARLPLREATRRGTAYAISNAAGTSYQEVDKTLILQLLGAAAVGPYTVAFRVTSMFALPVSALISATLPRLIAGHDSRDQQHNTYRAMLFAALGYGLLAGAAILVAAPLLPRVFGTDYGEATVYLQILAPWPALFALRQCIGAKLTATHQQHARTIIDVAGLLFLTILNLVLLPFMGVNASALALLATEVAVTLTFLATTNFFKNKA